MTNIAVGMTVRTRNKHILRHLRCRQAVIVGADQYQAIIRPMDGPYAEKEFYYGLKTFWEYFEPAGQRQPR